MKFNRKDKQIQVRDLGEEGELVSFFRSHTIELLRWSSVFCSSDMESSSCQHDHLRKCVKCSTDILPHAPFISIWICGWFLGRSALANCEVSGGSELDGC